MGRDIKIKSFYPYPVETIWRCMTDPEILKQWSLSKGDFRAEPGFKWTDERKARPRMNWDGKMYFEVLEVDPPHKLSYSFKGGINGVLSLDSVVTWTLAPRDNGTELTLEHTGFNAKNFFTSFVMEFGWRKISKRLSNVLESLKNER